jgi:hypothetical protein
VEEYTSVKLELQLISPFNGNKEEVSTSIMNVDMTFMVINPNHYIN